MRKITKFFDIKEVDDDGFDVLEQESQEVLLRIRIYDESNSNYWPGRWVYFGWYVVLSACSHPSIDFNRIGYERAIIYQNKKEVLNHVIQYMRMKNKRNPSPDVVANYGHLFDDYNKPTPNLTKGDNHVF